jgi:SAM-dependent methyltransferase
VTLAVEVFLSRLLAYTVQQLLVYVVLGVALLGFGAAGSLVFLRPAWLAPDRVDRALAWSALSLPVALVAGAAAFVRLAPLLPFAPGPAAFASAFVLTLPFLCGGTVVTLALSADRRRIGSRYAVNLAGSGLGCFVPLLLLGPLDGAQTLAVLALCGWLAALVYVLRVRPALVSRLSLACGASLVLVLAALSAAAHVFPIQADPWSQARLIRDFVAEKGLSTHTLFDRWNATGRVQYYAYFRDGDESGPYRFFAQDGSAGALAARWDGRGADHVPVGGSEVANLCSETIYGEGYYAARDRVLVIGVGAGADVQCALYNGAGHVDAVEINPDAIAAIRGPFDGYLGGIGSDPRVRYHLQDGRSFVHGVGPDRYDLVQVSAVDTKNLLVSGAMAMAENHVYTLEAFADYLDALAPGGVVAFIRFGEPEVLRLLHAALTALELRGVAEPEDHVVVIKNGVAFGLLVQPQPFEVAQLRALRMRFLSTDRPEFEGIFVDFMEVFGLPLHERPQVAYQPGSPVAEPLAAYVAARRAGEVDAFVAAAPTVMTPVHDDRPFFFDLARPGARYRATDVLLPLLGSIVVLALVLILLPLVLLAERPSFSFALTMAPFFAAVGLSYLLVEVWALHLFGLYLGHQSRALPVVLCGLLVASGVGARLGPRLLADDHRRAIVGVVATVLLVIAVALVAGPVMEATWHTGPWLRVAVALALLVAPGLAMGLPFPAGLGVVGSIRVPLLPWCVGINGCASVVATVAALPLALAHGYTGVLWAAVALYLVAGVLFLRRRAVRGRSLGSPRAPLW